MVGDSSQWLQRCHCLCGQHGQHTQCGHHASQEGLDPQHRQKEGSSWHSGHWDPITHRARSGRCKAEAGPWQPEGGDGQRSWAPSAPF